MTRRVNAEFGSVWKRLRISRVGVTIAIIAFLVLGGTGAYAFWGASTSLTTGASTGTLVVTTSWSTSLATTFTNTNLATTGEFTVSNTTSTTKTAPMPYTVALAYTGSAPGPLATNLKLTVWKKSGNCTSVGSPSYIGTWGAPPVVSGSLVRGTSELWCIRTDVDERSKLASTTGIVTLTPTVSATLTTGTQWTKTSTVKSDTEQKTNLIFPATVPTAGAWYRLKTTIVGKECGDIRGSGKVSNGDNTDMIAWACHGAPDVNQQFSFAATNTGYVTIAVRLEPSSRIGVVGNSTAVGALIENQAASTSTSNPSQEWQLQDKGTGYFQIVNRRSGLCIAPDAALATSVFKQVACTGASVEQFSIMPWAPIYVAPTCADQGNTGIRLSWNPFVDQDVIIQRRKGTTGTAWGPYGAAAAFSTGFSFNLNEFSGWARGTTHSYRILNASTNAELSSGTFSITSPPWWGSDYLACG